MNLAASTPIDMAHLSRYTGADPALDAEVLQLFAGQAGDLSRQLETAVEAGDRQAWQHITHSLKGASRGVGAFALAQIVADAEPVDPATEPRAARTLLQALARELAAIRSFVADHLSE